MSLDKKIQETFNPPPSLEGEDWLMPSNDVFDAIEDVVYADEKSKKRRFPFWLLLVPVFLIGSLLSVMISNGDKDASKRNFTNTEVMQNDKTSNSNALIQNDESSTSIDYETKTKSSLISSAFVNDKSSKSINNYEEGKVYSGTLLNKSNNQLSNKALFNHDSEIFSTKLFSGLISEDEDLLEDIFNSRITFENPSLLPLKTSTVIHQNTFGPIENLAEIDLLPNEKNDWFVKFSAGVSNWNFDLSENYLVALQPADFTYDNGNGYFIDLGIEKSITNKLNLGLLVSMDRNQFDSGHNSVINYDLSTEDNDNTKGFDLTMASPLGFLESNIVVARTVDASNNTNLTIDLANQHSVTNIDLGLYVDVQLYDAEGFSVSSQLGGGLDYLVHVTNTLDHFSTSEFGFNSKSSSIVSNQSDLTRLRPFVNLGFSLGYDFNHTTTIGINYQLRRDLNSIYQSGDFSTLVQRQLSGLYLKKRI